MKIDSSMSTHAFKYAMQKRPFNCVPFQIADVEVLLRRWMGDALRVSMRNTLKDSMRQCVAAEAVWMW